MLTLSKAVTSVDVLIEKLRYQILHLKRSLREQETQSS